MVIFTINIPQMLASIYHTYGSYGLGKGHCGANSRELVTSTRSRGLGSSGFSGVFVLMPSLDELTMVNNGWYMVNIWLIYGWWWLMSYWMGFQLVMGPAPFIVTDAFCERETSQKWMIKIGVPLDSGKPQSWTILQTLCLHSRHHSTKFQRAGQS